MVATPLETSSSPQRIDAIDGLRAWLAWTVVIGHIVQISGIDLAVPFLAGAEFLATQAVQIFIIISGFVIAGVVIDRREKWTSYITRRAFRIFPTYLLLLPLGLVTTYLAGLSITHMSWADDPRFTWDDSMREMIASIEAYPLVHAVAHATLLQGVIPDSVLPHSSAVFIGPAWSLSLEWQFYLIAPVLVWMAQRRAGSLAAVIALFALAAAARLGAFGFFRLPSFFPTLGFLFLVGIASRLVFSALRRAPLHFVAIAAACFAGALLYRSVFSIAVWAAFFALLLCAERTADERLVSRARRVAFESPLALHLGARSYAVYLVHWPLVQLMTFLILPLAPFSQWQAVALIGAATIIATAIASEALHAGVERPMIRVGAALVEGRGLRTRRLNAAPEAS